ncbi:hypothetical protein Syun_016030 [Stephania yunnanensis]|uniref:Uncharacterized protein n=1 Tax=Stephania yunnanensis TaxID=152371 RepID=A0AAP0J6E2_9MAGN
MANDNIGVAKQQQGTSSSRIQGPKRRRPNRIKARIWKMFVNSLISACFSSSKSVYD